MGWAGVVSPRSKGVGWFPGVVWKARPRHNNTYLLKEKSLDMNDPESLCLMHSGHVATVQYEARSARMVSKSSIIAFAHSRLPLSSAQYKGEMDWVPTVMLSNSEARLLLGAMAIAFLSARAELVLIAFITSGPNPPNKWSYEKAQFQT